jgi:hypothetical protein
MTRDPSITDRPAADRPHQTAFAPVLSMRQP